MEGRGASEGRLPGQRMTIYRLLIHVGIWTSLTLSAGASSAVAVAQPFPTQRVVHPPSGSTWAAKAPTRSQAAVMCTRTYPGGISDSIETRSGLYLGFLAATGTTCRAAKKAAKSVSWSDRLVWPAWKCSVLTEPKGPNGKFGKFRCRKGSAIVKFSILQPL